VLTIDVVAINESGAKSKHTSDKKKFSVVQFNKDDQKVRRVATHRCNVILHMHQPVRTARLKVLA
jgi:hypothetical protein